jgi:hypothetical protein
MDHGLCCNGQRLHSQSGGRKLQKRSPRAIYGFVLFVLHG